MGVLRSLGVGRLSTINEVMDEVYGRHDSEALEEFGFSIGSGTSFKRYASLYGI